MSPPAATLPNTPYVIQTSRLVIRCLGPDDAARRKEAVDSSGEHLGLLFPPSPEGPMSLDAHAAHVRRFRANFDSDQDRAYGAFDPASGRMLGEVFLLKRSGIAALEVGYWLRRDATGQGIATEMTAALLKVAFELDKVKRVDLLCSPANERSAAVARRLGFTFEGQLRDRQIAAHHIRGDLLSFSLLVSEYPETQAGKLALEAFDFLGRQLL